MSQKQPENIHPICATCYGKCKQSDKVTLIFCPNHDPHPVQLELKLILPKKPRKKTKAG